MSETTEQDSQNPETPETVDVLPETTSQRTYLSDTGHGPLPDVPERGPVTTYADHVPDDAPTLLSSQPQTKVVAAPAAETAAPAGVDVETA